MHLKKKIKKGVTSAQVTPSKGQTFNEELEALLEAGALARAVAQVIQAGSANLAVSIDHNFFQPRRAGEEGSFNTNAIAGDPAHGETGIGTIVMGEENCSFEFLHTFAGAFFNSHMHTDDITWCQFGNIRVDSGLNRLQ